MPWFRKVRVRAMSKPIRRVVYEYPMSLLDPHGTIAQQELRLIIIAALLSVVVVVPVFVMLIGFAIRYREGNHTSTYDPELVHGRGVELVWWLVPTGLIVILSVITWTSTHQLDPYRSIAPADQTMQIDVVALDWKWLFVYPGQNIATVNTLTLPDHTAVDFHITSDAPMNSLWIPNLAGQIYAMPGMQTDLNIDATSDGRYQGVSANLSGTGFSDMSFTTNVVSAGAFDGWVARAQGSPHVLSQTGYPALSCPTSDVPATIYVDRYPALFDDVVMKYMGAATPSHAGCPGGGANS